MQNTDFAIAAGALMRILVSILYAPICIVVLRRLFPRLSWGGRLLATGMLAAQIVILIVGLEDSPRWELKGWLWHLDQEWNIPSTFASIQLAMVSGAALAAATLGRAYRRRYRLFIAAIGLFFLFLAWDEYFTLHETDLALEAAYIASGIAIAGMTLLATARSPHRARLWHICLLAGMVLNVTGAMMVDALPQICRRLGSIQLEGCLYFYNLEESFEFLGVWLILVAVLGILTEAAPKLPHLIFLCLSALPVCWILLVTSDVWRPRLELRLTALPASIAFESGLNLLGYTLDWNREAIDIWLYPSAWRSRYERAGFSIHLVDQASGKSVASRNRHALPQFHLLLAPGFAHVYRQQILVEIPPETPTNRAYWITLSVWRDESDEFVSQKVIESDHQQLNETQVILDELVFPAPAASVVAPLAEFGGAYTLGIVDLPESASPGSALSVSFTWRANAAGEEDLVQFLHLGHIDSGEWWVFDRQPLGPRLPTRLWYMGLTENETWEVRLPPDLATGQYRVYTGMYRLRDQERISASDAYGSPFADARVPLGSLNIEGA